MDYANIIAAVIGGLTAALPLFLFISKRTANQVDDRLAAVLEKFLLGIGTSPAKTEAALTTAGIGTSPAKAETPLAPL